MTDYLARVELFNQVRDTKYTLRNNCQTKVVALQKSLKTLGLTSELVLCTYHWEDLNLPKEIMSIPHGVEDPLHVYLSVYIPETLQWTVVDPTWDSAIKHPVIHASLWDGLNNTETAVRPIKTYTVRERDDFYNSVTPESTKAFMNENRAFLNAFNDYLEDCRK